MLEDITIEKLKNMQVKELEVLANEIREKIINTVSKNGGHLSSNLGVVELTIALHKVFDSPKDKIIFDVGHQTYTHKLLTGRYDKFDTLRQFNGLSGFAKRTESEHDVFEAGHSSTAISAGLGLLEGRINFPNEIGEVITITGDASIGNGLCFEALNYLADHQDKKMIVIINDNNMSVSKNVGALAKRYNKIRIKSSLKFIKRITPVRIKHALQYWAYKVDLFTSLGFKYFENIDGHDFNELIRYLTFAKESNKSIVLHIKTTKGKGYKYAEEDVIGKWHGTGPFNIETGELLNKNSGLTFGNVAAKELIELTKNDQTIRVICPAMILGCGIDEYEKECPNNTIDIGISEENGFVMAASMAQSGLKPIIFIYSTFLQRGYDELIHDIARTNTHVVICVDHAGIVPGDGSTHQGIYDMAMIASAPGFKVFQPADNADLIAMLNQALYKEDGPIVIRYPKGLIPITNNNAEFSYEWDIIKDSKDKYVITYGPDIMEINEVLKDYPNIGLINAKVTSPIDEKLLKKLDKKTIYIYEQVIYPGSLTSLISKYVIENNLDIRIKGIYLKDGYLEEGKVSELKNYHHVSYDDLITIIKGDIDA